MISSASIRWPPACWTRSRTRHRRSRACGGCSAASRAGGTVLRRPRIPGPGNGRRSISASCRPARTGWWPRSRARGSVGPRRRAGASGRAATDAAVWADEPVRRFESVVEPVVDLAEFQKLDVGELDDLQGVGTLRIGDHACCPVEYDEVVGGIREAQAGGLADFLRG